MAVSIEIVAKKHLFVGMILISSCDCLISGQLMAAARVNIPTILVTTGGPIMPGICKGKEIKTSDVNESVLDESLLEKDLIEMEDGTCPGFGACPVMGTDNTMQILNEAMGIFLPSFANIPAIGSYRYPIAKKAGNQIVRLIKKGITPSKIITRDSL